MNRAARPSTAPAHKNRTASSGVTALNARTAFDHRPLGRLPMPHKLQAEVQSGNAASVVSGLKSECLMLQRRIDEVKQEDSAVEMELLEQTLMSIQSSNIKDRLDGVKNTLLELLTQKMQELSKVVLQKCDAETTTANGPGRTAAFNTLVDYVLGIAERKQVWEERIERASNHQAAPERRQHLQDIATQSGSGKVGVDTLDLALNEPTAAEVRKLIEEQRQLRVLVTKHFTPPKPAAEPTQTPPPEKALSEKPAKGGKKSPSSPTPDIDSAAAQIKELTAANAAYKKRIVDLELEVRRLNDHTEAYDDEKNISALALEPQVRTQLASLDINVVNFAEVSEQEAASIGQRFTTWAAEAMSAVESKGSRSKKEGGGYEGLLLTYLNRQNKILADVLKRLDTATNDKNSQVKENEVEIARLKRIVATLEQRVQSLKSTAQRATMRHEAAIADANQEAQKFKKLFEESSGEVPETKRLVNVKNQSATLAEREKSLREELGYSQQCVGDLTRQLEVLKTQCEQEQANSAVIRRERQSLMQKISDEGAIAKRASGDLQSKLDEIQQLKDLVAQLRRENREKVSVEADTQQRAWKLEMELHIAQNVIGELRQREDVLTKNAMQARDCQETLRTELDSQRDVVAKLKTEMEQHIHEADTDRVVAQEVLSSERSKMIENEKEVERLRSLDLQMEVLEQNFTNYAASKLAQREASEEEERAMQTCMETVQRDVFNLPCDSDSEDQLNMYLKQLEAQKVMFDNEERIRKRNKATTVNFKDERSGKKQLTQLLRMRYNAIQIFGVQQRLRQIHLERDNRNYRIENNEIKRRHDLAANELAQARLQCDSLIQRSTELDLERKQLIRTRTSSELEIKNLKSAIQRMRISGEEQEKILVEVGTRLQCFKMNDPDAKSTRPLDNVVVGSAE